MPHETRQVVILAGGPSPEAAVSRVSSAGMLAACQELGLNAEIWELEGDWIGRLAALPKEGLFVLLGLHGSPGEDGSVQGVLDLLGLPYNGSGMAASALAMDKILSRMVMAEAGLEVADALHGKDLEDPAKVAAFVERYGRVVVKPSLGGSTIGVTVVDRLSQWPAALAAAEKYGPVLVEAFVSGLELTVAVCGQTAWPVIEIATGERFFDYDAKYGEAASPHVIPARIQPEIENRARAEAVVAATAVGASGICRVDFRHTPGDNGQTARLVVLEVNTLPGMTPTSLVPDAARAADMAYGAVVQWMIEDGWQRWSARRT